MAKNFISSFLASVRGELAPVKKDAARTPDTDAADRVSGLGSRVSGEDSTQSPAPSPPNPSGTDPKPETRDPKPDASATPLEAGIDTTPPTDPEKKNTEITIMATPATMAELKTAFPGDKHMAFREECIEKSLELPAAKALMGDRLMAKGEADEKAAAEKAAKEKLLGGAGKSDLKSGAAPGEQSGQITPRTFTKDELLSPTTGKIGPVPGAETYAQAVAGYRSAGIKDAEYWAQVNHRDLWLPEREKRGEQHMATHGSRDAERAKRK